VPSQNTVDPQAFVGLAGVPVTMFFVNMLRASFGLPDHYALPAAVVISVLLNLGVGWGILHGDPGLAVLNGLVAGMASSGFYSGSKALNEHIAEKRADKALLNQVKAGWHGAPVADEYLVAHGRREPRHLDDESWLNDDNTPLQSIRMPPRSTFGGFSSIHSSTLPAPGRITVDPALDRERPEGSA
jgi:hypothetical protein